MIFGPSFMVTEQYLVLVWADLHLFWTILTALLGQIFSVQTCNAPNVPKISPFIVKTSMKLNGGIRLAIL